MSFSYINEEAVGKYKNVKKNSNLKKIKSSTNEVAQVAT